MFPGVRSSLVFSGFGLRDLLPLVFSRILTVVSRLLHLYSTDDKTSRLMMKFLHSEGHPERYIELHGEEGGGRYR